MTIVTNKPRTHEGDVTAITICFELDGDCDRVHSVIGRG